MKATSLTIQIITTSLTVGILFVSQSEASKNCTNNEARNVVVASNDIQSQLVLANLNKGSKTDAVTLPEITFSKENDQEFLRMGIIPDPNAKMAAEGYKGKAFVYKCMVIAPRHLVFEQNVTATPALMKSTKRPFYYRENADSNFTQMAELTPVTCGNSNAEDINNDADVTQDICILKPNKTILQNAPKMKVNFKTSNKELAKLQKEQGLDFSAAVIANNGNKKSVGVIKLASVAFDINIAKFSAPVGSGDLLITRDAVDNTPIVHGMVVSQIGDDGKYKAVSMNVVGELFNKLPAEAKESLTNCK